MIMMKFMKYEIKGTYKYILGVLALALILITGLHGYINRMDHMSVLGNMFVSISVLILFGTAIVTFFYIVGSFKKELDEDRGYLTFTLPLTGNQIVASKLIVSLMWSILLGIIMIAYNALMVFVFNSSNIDLWMIIKEIVYDLKNIISIKGVLFSILISIFSLVNMLVLIYFSMVLGKVTFRNKKIGGLWFVIFLVITILLSYGQFKISESLPHYLDLNTFSIEKFGDLSDSLNNEIMIEANHSGFYINSNMGILEINIASSIFSILTTVGLFLGTGYLIEKRIDL